MSAPTSTLRQALAGLLLIVLTLSGVGRALALADLPSQPATSLMGVAVPLCHPDSGGGSTAPGRHDCCDVCALNAPVALPGEARFVAPARIEHFAEHGAAFTWAPTLARVPTPRLSQGPPAA